MQSPNSQKTGKSDKSGKLNKENVYNCVICYDSLKKREDVINPCNCKGDTKYMCISCFNRYLSVNKDSNKYNKCSVCNSEFKRNTEVNSRKIKSETRNEILFAVSFTLILNLCFIKLSQIKEIYPFILLIYYIITICLISVLFPSPHLNYIILLLFAFCLTLPEEESHKIFCLWTIGLFGIISYLLIRFVWDNLEILKLKKFLQTVKSKFFDVELNKYVDI